MRHPHMPINGLPRFTDAIVEDVLLMTDADVLAEFAAAGGDAEKNAAEMRAMFERVAAQHGGRG